MEELFGEENEYLRHPPLDVTSRAFQSKKFIQRVLANVSHAFFEGQLVDKVGAAEEDTGEALKQLIRDNLAVFINSKDAMNAVYNSDTELFTGEALDGITDSFKGATTSCDSLVQPITATFLEVQKSRKSQDMLDKFFSVLGVPGAVYDCCGAKVAQRRQSAAAAAAAADPSSSSDTDDDREGKGRRSSGGKADAKARRRVARRRADNEDEDDEEDEEDEEDEDEEASDDAAVPARARGALENPTGSTDPAELYVLAEGEEVFAWYGTPLVRLKDVEARRHHVEQTSNYEAAVLHLRRAMLYVEETYSLMDGTMLLAGDSGEPASGAAAAGTAGTTAAGGGEIHSSSGGQGGAASSPAPAASAAAAAAAGQASGTSPSGRSVFAYKFSMALLRAALYLCSQLAEELVYANPADTVLIEDTLSMMMDASIASVKLHHLCGVLQEALGEGDRHGQVLTKLRTQLSSTGPAADEGGSAAGGGGGAAAADFASASSRGATRQSGSLNTASPLGGGDDHSFGYSPNHSISGGPGPGDASPAPTSGDAGRGRRGVAAYQHPVQFFISIVQRQQKHLFHSSAAALLREASGWLWKAQTDAARGLEERHREQERQRRLRAAAAGGADVGESGSGVLGSSSNATFGWGGLGATSFLSGSIGGDAGFIGNANDSFLQDGSFTWMNARAGGGALRRRSSAGSPLGRGPGEDDGGAAGLATSGSGVAGEEGRTPLGAIPDAYVARVLDAFNTPESPFPTSTELRVGGTDMDTVLAASCLQIRLHSASLLSQLFTRADIESAVMAQASALNSFALRLCAECVGTLEHVVGSYWGGIATTLHAGIFDFAPEPSSALHGILTHLLGSSPAQAAAAADGISSGGDGLQRSPSAILTGTHSRAPSGANDGERDAGDAETSEGDDGEATAAATAAAAKDGGAGAEARGRRAGVTAGVTDQLPRVRFVPTLPQAFYDAAAASAAAAARRGAPAPPDAPRLTCLRDISVRAVHHMISTATATLRSLFVAFINRSVADGFVGALARYRVSDLSRFGRTERVELHAAVLYEIILGQWERMMNLVSHAVLRLKVVIGESSSSTTIASEAQVEEVGALLQELELLRSTCLRCYLHGIGVLTKAYLTALPLVQRHSDTTSLDARVRSRLSRESVSSNAVHKLLNVFSVVMDRCVPFFTRDAEVFDSVDLFAVKSENLREDDEDDEDGAGGGGGRGGTGAGGGRRSSAREAAARRRRLLRRRAGEEGSAGAGGGYGEDGGRYGRYGNGGGGGDSNGAGPGDGAETMVDPVSELVAQFHSRLVMETLQDHEELVLALLSHLLLAFVDMLQLKARTATTDVTLGPEERERCVVECMADTLCLATTLTPIMMEHLLTPCFFEVIARQLPELCPTPVDVAALLQNQQQQYSQVYLSVVEEHCQLAVDAMMSTYLALAQQPITDLVRRQGFVQPLFDWQRVSPHTTAAVRPYIADAIACIARAHETLNAIRQPVLGSAATQRLVAHLVRVFLTSLTSDVNVFELSAECSSSFLVYGLTLIEAEAATVLRVVDAVVAHVRENPATTELLPELAAARDSLGTVTQTLEGYTNAVCDALAAARSSEGGGSSSSSSTAIALSILSRDKRHERRDGMVQTAMRTLAYMLEAVNTELEESSMSSAALLQQRSAAAAKGGAAAGSRSAVAERIVQRIERRKEGYEMRRTRAAAAAQEEKQRQEAEAKRAAALARRGKPPIPAPAPAAPGADARDAVEGDDGAGAGGKRRVLRRRPQALAAPLADPADVDGDAGDALTQRTAQEKERASTAAAEAASDVFQLAQGQQQKRKLRRVRKSADGAGAAGGDAGVAPAAAVTAPARPTVALASVPPSVAGAGVLTGGVRPEAGGGDDEDGDGAAAPARNRVPRRARRRLVSNDGNDAGGGAAEDDGGGGARHERRANRFRRSNAL